jgi:hypothetical protein
MNQNMAAVPPSPRSLSRANRDGLRPAAPNHLIEDIASHHHLRCLRLGIARTKSVTKDRVSLFEGGTTTPAPRAAPAS